MSSLFAGYRQALKLLEGSLFEEAAAFLADLRTIENEGHDPAAEAARRLLSVRVALRQNHLLEDLVIVESLAPKEEWIQGERAFVLGLFHFHHARFAVGAEYFAAAAAHFRQAGWAERIALALYNAFIGNLNSGRWTTTEESILRLKAVEREAHEFGCRRTKALVARQMSYFLHDLAALEASRRRIFEALEYFEIFGPSSDAHLCLLQAADVSLDLNDEAEARRSFERVLAPLDSRILFPHAYIKSRLDGGLVSPSDFAVVSDLWREKFDRHFANASSTEDVLVWDSRRQCLERGSEKITLREGGKEALLLRFLMGQAASKTTLIEFLWPESGDPWALENRLHKLVSRLNQKIPNAIIFDGRVYRCAKKVVAS